MSDTRDDYREALRLRAEHMSREDRLRESIEAMRLATEDDIEGADQKTKYVNYIFYRENNGFNVLYEAIKDGLIMKNGIIKVYPEVNKSVRFSSFQGLTEMQAAMLADEEGVEFVGASWEIEEDGTPLFYLEVKHVSDDIKIRVEAVAPEEFSVVGWHKSVLYVRPCFLTSVHEFSSCLACSPR